MLDSRLKKRILCERDTNLTILIISVKDLDSYCPIFLQSLLAGCIPQNFREEMEGCLSQDIFSHIFDKFSILKICQCIIYYYDRFPLSILDSKLFSSLSDFVHIFVNLM